MSSNEARTALAATIWIAVAVACFGIGIYGANSGRDVGVLFVISLVIAVVSTFMVWGFSLLDEWLNRSRRQAAPEHDKAKRQGDDRLSLLLSLMDEDEVVAFKAALQQRLLDDVSAPHDGELPYDAQTLEALLYDEGMARHQES
ncbi:MAG: hypothetical protein JW910_23410 [Anaerolineae bacterium]|nr:hypothetical protein [Anaerolineae bacterium]